MVDHGGRDPPQLLAAELAPSSFGAKASTDTIAVDVTSFLDEPTEVVFFIRALDETQRIVKQLSAGQLGARGRRVAEVRIEDIGLALNPLTVSGVLSIYPLLVTEAGARTPPSTRALRLHYHPANGRLLLYDSATRSTVYRGGALTPETAFAASAGSELLPGYRGFRPRPAHDGDGEPDSDGAAVEGGAP